jgi:hypothetical protein
VLAAVVAIGLVAPGAAGAETGAQDPAAALARHEATIAAEPGSYEALWRAADAATDLGAWDGDAARQKALLAKAETFARRAVQANAGGADGHYVLARVLGRTARLASSRERIAYAAEVRRHAEEAVRLAPAHAGALHLLGMWHAEVMRRSRIERFLARTLFGAALIDTATWDDAVQYLERSVAADPARLAGHLDLGLVYADVGDGARAREQLEWVVRAVPRDVNDPHRKREAERALHALR